MKVLLASVVLASPMVVGVVTATPASALSCVGPQAVLERAGTIYTGRILESSDDEVVVEVDEVWKGAVPPARATFDVDLPEWWEMEGTGGEAGRVVVAPVDGALNPCTVFPLEGADGSTLRAFRPASPASPVAPRKRQPIDAGARPGGVDHTWTWVASGAGAGVVLVVAGTMLIRRRRA